MVRHCVLPPSLESVSAGILSIEYIAVHVRRHCLESERVYLKIPA
jgi:hypothetical protein